MAEINVHWNGELPNNINMCWECPVCGSQVGQANSDTAICTILPPTCQLAHAPTEMEQRTAERWGRQFEEDES